MPPPSTRTRRPSAGTSRTFITFGYSQAAKVPHRRQPQQRRRLPHRLQPRLQLLLLRRQLLLHLRHGLFRHRELVLPHYQGLVRSSCHEA
jgi:hypothetical protein